MSCPEQVAFAYCLVRRLSKGARVPLSRLRVEREYLQLDGLVPVCGAVVWLIRQTLALHTQDSNLAVEAGNLLGNSCCECCD